jgi:para-aminobenzoate synthetase component 1
MPTCFVHPIAYHIDPTGYFSIIRHAPGAVLLDSGRPDADRGRFDIISAWPLETLAPATDESGAAFLQRLRASVARLGEADLPESNPLPFAGGLIGYLAYDLGRLLEPLPTQAVDDLHLPSAGLGLYAWALISDHQLRTSQLVFHPQLADDERQRLIDLFGHPLISKDTASEHAASPDATFSLTAPFKTDISANQYRDAIERIHGYIEAGDCYQVNFAQRFRASYSGDPWVAYQALREACPTPVFRLSEPSRGRCGAEPVARALRQSQPGPGRNPPDQGHPTSWQGCKRTMRPTPKNYWPATKTARKT